MTRSQERLDIIKSILSDNVVTQEEDEALHILLTEKVSKADLGDSKKHLTFGQRAADDLAKFAGSWGFIIVFFTVLITWIVVNLFLAKPFDIYPFVLLNLVLSCLAAIQAPVIMMSQNRQEMKDRIRAKNDYKVNLKAEIMVEDMHEKLDTIIAKQQELIDRLMKLEEKKVEKQGSED